MPSSPAEFRIGDTWNGLNRSIAPQDLSPQQSPDCADCRNFNRQLGALGPRLGRKRILTAANAILGLGMLSAPIGRFMILATADGTWAATPMAWTGSTPIPEGSVIQDTVLSSGEIDLSATAAFSVSIPSGTFFIDEIELVVTVADDTVTTQPTFKAGITGSDAKYLTGITPTQLTAAKKRQGYTTLLADDGETTALLFTITSAGAVASGNYKGIFIVRGTTVR